MSEPSRTEGAGSGGETHRADGGGVSGARRVAGGTVGAGGGAVTAEPSELVKLRFDYAWKWFSFHAEQRTKMFNFMLLGLGILATAYVSAVDKGLYLESLGISVTATVLAIAFALIDGRNEKLYRAALTVLMDAELKNLFGDARIVDHQGASVPFGISRRIAIDDRDDGVLAGILRGKHRYMLRLIAAAFALLFVAGGWSSLEKASRAAEPKAAAKAPSPTASAATGAGPVKGI